MAQGARNVGLLPDSAIEQLVVDAMRHQAGHKLLETAQKIQTRVQSAGIAPMSDEEIVAEVKAVRAERGDRAQSSGVLEKRET